MNFIDSSGEVLKVYQTGDRPVLVLCADGHHYICKYKQPGGAANKLINELIGSELAKCCGLYTPQTALIHNSSRIWRHAGISHDTKAPLFGSRKMDNVFDLNEINCEQVVVSPSSLEQLLRIALFDFWLSNEDRTCNNYNLLYDLKHDRIISIDYGGIFNSGVSGQPVYQLNEYDSILTSDLFVRLKAANSNTLKDKIYFHFIKSLRGARKEIDNIIAIIPYDWSQDTSDIVSKMDNLFASSWIEDTWNNFISIAKL